MAEFRSVKTAMWREDDWFQELPVDGRLLFIYLFTNPSASVAGIYKLPLRTIVFESGIPHSRVCELLDKFADDEKAWYENGVVWVRRMREHQLPGKISQQLLTRLARDIDNIPDTPMKQRYLSAYGIANSSIPYEYPTDTVSIPVATDTDTESDTNTDTDTKELAREKRESARKKRESAPKAPPPAEIELVRSITNRYPDKALWESIVTAVAGKSEGDIREAYRVWVGRGFKPTNYAWLLEWVPNGIPPAPGRPNGKASTVPDGLPDPAVVWTVIQAEIDRVHYYGAPNLPPPIMTAIEAVGGWYNVAKCDPAGAIPSRLRDAYRHALTA